MDADIVFIGRVESLHITPHKGSRQRIQACIVVAKKLGKSDVGTLMRVESISDRLPHFFEIDRAKASVHDDAMSILDFLSFRAAAPDGVFQLWNITVDELGASLRRRGLSWAPQRMHSAAGTLASFQDDHSATFIGQAARGG